jgi:hypothetical protein
MIDRALLDLSMPWKRSAAVALPHVFVAFHHAFTFSSVPSSPI